MERLVSTSEAAKILGLSLQGVHYRIKNNKVKSIQKDGKTFVYIDENMEQKSKPSTTNNTNTPDFSSFSDKFINTYDLLIKEKNRQIKMLQKSIKWMDRQYKSEIQRLEDNQNKIIDVFNSEIKLLQSAFNEMRSIYHQPREVVVSKTEQQNEEKTQEIVFMDIKEFFVLMKRYGKTNQEIKILIIDLIKRKDKRFIYNKNEKSILILKDDFKDLK